MQIGRYNIVLADMVVNYQLFFIQPARQTYYDKGAISDEYILGICKEA